MKKHYFLLLLFCFIFTKVNAQDIYPNLVKANRNITAGLKAYNIKSLQYHAKISKLSIDSSIQELTNEDCQKASDLSTSITIRLESALLAQDFATAEAHLVVCEELISKLFYEFNLCATNDSAKNTNTELAKNNETELSKLEMEQAKLLEEQSKLKEKERKIEAQLAQQKSKQKQQLKANFIKLNKETIISNIESYNASLKACDCNRNLDITFDGSQDFSNLEFEAIKSYFLDENIKLTKAYTSLLKDCKSE
ncbi:hypothetical protein [Winogradskyella ursingii]|uniref:hypothetical protein n=1 Tax=Winogradskyella ursingii TaxID=2686079 RepID=UPI0015CBE485|nr:hypothetical protein [Winogradskyella ursingii]